MVNIYNGQPRALTTSYNGIANVLSNEVHISAAFNPKTSLPPTSFKTFNAVWDTGASASVITAEVAKQCGLKPTGMISVSTAAGKTTTETYLVSLRLLNEVGFPSVKVSKGDLAGCDVLIGMDIIGTGDFAVTNKDGKTVFSFRMPSLERIDFVKDPQHQGAAPVQITKISRNAKCPCGSGKKHKRCCGAGQSALALATAEQA